MTGGSRIGFMAGLEYGLWTRDAAFNAWNGLAWLAPQACHDSLTAALVRDDADRVSIGGQYWDTVIWAEGAWTHYVHSGDVSFLSLAHEALTHTLADREVEFDPEYALYRGPAVYGDGCSAYPDTYATASGAIYDWPRENPQDALSVGGGMPCFALSTNLVYCRAFELVQQMAVELGLAVVAQHTERYQLLSGAIEKHFAQHNWRYLAGSDDDTAQEGLGVAFAVLFNHLSDDAARQFIQNCYRSPHGIPALHPAYQRYTQLGGIGRHSGSIWLHVNTMFAAAAAHVGALDVFESELMSMATLAVRHGQFPEVVHPITGDLDGGLQEYDGELDSDWAAWCITGVQGQTAPGHRVAAWQAMRRQSWCATGFVRLMVEHLAGLRFMATGLTVRPHLPSGCDQLELRDIRWRDRLLSIHVSRGSEMSCRLNGQPCSQGDIPFVDLPTGDLSFVVTLGPDRP